MASNKTETVVDIKGNFEPMLEEAKKALKRLEQESATLNLTGSDKSRLAEAKARASVAEGMMGSGTLQGAELKEFQKLMNELFKDILMLSTKMLGLSPELQEKVKSLSDETATLGVSATEAKDRLEELKKEMMVKPDGSVGLTPKAKEDFIKEQEIPFIFGRGNVAKPETIEPYLEKLREKMSQGNLSIEEQEKLPKIIAALEEAKKKLAEYETTLPQVVKDLQDIVDGNVEKIKQTAADAAAAAASTPGSAAPGAPAAPAGTPPGGPSPLEQIAQTTIKNRAEMNAQIAQTGTATQKATQATAQNSDAVKKNDNVVTKAIRNIFEYGLVFKTLKNLVAEARRTIKELDKALTDQAVVTGMTRKQAYELLGTYQEIAKVTGTTTTEISKVATEYLRQGKTLKEALILTETAAKAARIAGISTGESVNYLTTAVNGFRLAAEDAIVVSDKFAALAASSASNYEELAIALSKVASQAGLAGLSVDYTLALLAKGVETTREPAESIGTALKTIIARMRELTDFGRTLEEGMSLNNVQKQLEYVNISLTDQNGQLRSTQEVLDQVGRKWSTFSINQQAAIAKALAGTRQQSRLIAILNDYERTLELVTIAQEADGATAAQHTQYMQGLEASMARLNTAYQSFISNLTSSDVIVVLINVIAGLVDGVAMLFANDFWGPFFTILALIVAGVMGLVGLWKMLGFQQAAANKKIMEQNALQKQSIQLAKQKRDEEARILETLIAQKQAKGEDISVDQAKLTKLKAENAAADTQDATDLKGINDSNKAMNMQNIMAAANFYITAVVMLATFIGQGIAAYNKAIRPASEVAEENIKKVSTRMYQMRQSTRSLDTAISKFEDLSKKTVKTKEDMEQLNQIMEQTKNTLSEEQQAFAEGMDPDEYLEYLKKISKSNKSFLRTQSTQNMESMVEAAEKFNTVLVATATGVGALAGGAAGAAIGAAMGSVVPLVGNLIGGIVGGIVGAVGGAVGAFSAATTDDFMGDAFKTEAMLDSLELDRPFLKKTLQNFFKDLVEPSDFDNLNKETATQVAAFVDNLIGNIDPKELFRRMDIPTDLKEQGEAVRKEIAHQYGLNEDQIKALAEGDAAKIKELFVSETDLEALEEYGKKYSALIKTTFDDELVALFNNAETAKLITAVQSGNLVDRANAFKELTAALGENSIAAQALATEYPELNTLLEEFGENGLDVLDVFTKFNVTIESLERLKDIVKDIGVDFTDILLILDEMKDIDGIEAQKAFIEEYIAGLIEAEEITVEEAQIIRNALSSIVSGTGASNVLSGVTQLSNEMENIYKTQAKWAEMTAAEQMAFMEQNPWLQDPEAFEAFVTGRDLSPFLLDAYGEDIAARREELVNAITAAQIEGNLGLVALLTGQLNDLDSITENSLDNIIKNQQKQLTEYKKLLKSEKDAVVKNLEARKKAYEKYYDAINKQFDVEDFEKQRANLTAQLTKLGAATDATSLQKAQELRKKLGELDKEEAQRQREQAQQAVLESIDEELKTTNEYYDELLNNDQEMLNMMRDQLQNDRAMLDLQYLNYLLQSGMTQEQISQAWDVWNQSMGMGTVESSAQLVDILPFTTEVVQTEDGPRTVNTINISGQEYKLDAEKFEDFIAVLRAALVRYGYSV